MILRLRNKKYLLISVMSSTFFGWTRVLHAQLWILIPRATKIHLKGWSLPTSAFFIDMAWGLNPLPTRALPWTWSRDWTPNIMPFFFGFNNIMLKEPPKICGLNVFWVWQSWFLWVQWQSWFKWANIGKLGQN